MKITISPSRDVIEKVRKIAGERNTTLSALVNSHLERLVAEHAERRKRQLEALERSFQDCQFSMGKRTWKREDLYKRR